MSSRRAFHQGGAWCFFFCCLILSLAGLPVWAATYYVDATGGNDSNNGTATTRAWKTLNKVSNTLFNPGDSILFKRGEVWRGQLAVTSSGTSTANITYGAYSTGDKPLFNGADVVTAWTSIGGGRYTATVTTEPDLVVFNGTVGARQPDVSSVNAANEWYWASNVLTIYSASAPTGMEVATRHFMISFNGLVYARVQDIALRYTIDSVLLSETNNCVLSNLTLTDCCGMAGIILISYAAGKGEYNTVQNCTVSNVCGSAESLATGNDGCGIYLYNEMCKHNTVSGCAVDHCGLEGIIIFGGSYNRIANSTVSQCGEAGFRVALETAIGNTVEGNVSYQNAQKVDDRYGIDLIRVGNDNIVRYNTVHDQHDTLNDPNIPGNNGNPKYGSGGIRFDGGDWAGHDYMDSTGNKAYYNLIYNEGTGISSFNFSNIEMYNNVVYHTTIGGIGFISASATISSNNTAKNNIVCPAQGFAFARYRATQNHIDNNRYYASPSPSFQWDSSIVNFATWKTNSQQDANSLVADPLFVNPAIPDFHLQSNSPCIDHGVNAGLIRDFEGTAVPQRSAPDIGAYELPPPTITVTAPNGGETYTTGDTRTIQWTYTGDPGTVVRIELLDGSTPTPLTDTAPAGAGGTGSWSWSIPLSQAPGSNYQVRVTSISYPACTDSSNAVFTITAPTITVTVPNGGETWVGGETHAIQWNYTLSPGANVKIELLAGGTPAVLAASVSLGGGGSGSWNWTIPASQPAASNYRIRVTSTTNLYCTDTSNADFAIAAPTITVTSPNGGETWLGGESHTIAWTFTGVPGLNVRIELLNGGTPTVIAPSVSIGASGIGSWVWTVPAAQADGSQYAIRVTSTDTASCTDTSNANFIIHPAAITVTSPNGGETWLGGETHAINWTYTGYPGTNVQIELLNGATPTLLSSGIPITQGSWNWDVPAAQADGANYRIRISSTSAPACLDSSNADFTIHPAMITVYSPNGGEVWVGGETHTIQWTYTGYPGPRVQIELLNGAASTVLASSVAIGAGAWDWPIPTTLASGTNYRVRITSASTASCTDSSDNDFTINASAITVTIPNGAEQWTSGEIHTLRWTYTGNPGPNVRIELRDGAATVVLAESVPIGSASNGEWDWRIPFSQTPGTNFRMRVVSTDTPACDDVSNDPFTIAAAPSDGIAIASPDGGESWATGEIHVIHWSYAGEVGADVRIDLLEDGSPTTLAASVPVGADGAGSWEWNIPLSRSPGTQYRVQVTSTSHPVYTSSSAADFTITAASLTVTTPNGGEVWTVGETRTIHWTYTGNPGPSLSVGGITSSTAELMWQQFSGADHIDIYVGAEPAASPADPLPEPSIRVATLPGTSTRYRIEKLAAATDAFIRVKAIAPDQTTVLGVLDKHVRTAGGPGAVLDTPVREIHAMGRQVLLIVLANDAVLSYAGPTGSVIGDQGPDWQSGPWTVTRSDGSTAIPVLAIRRHSAPVGQPYYDNGWAAAEHENYVDVDHRIYLVLGEPIGQREILQIQGPFGTQFVAPFSDSYLETPVIQVNQVGYSPKAQRRYAYVSGWLGVKAPAPDYEHASVSMDDFPDAADVVIESKDPGRPRQTALASLAIDKAYRSNDPGAGGPVARIDLSQLPAAEGTVYRVRVPGVGVSWPTQVSNAAMFKAFYVTMRGIYYARWGRDLDPPYSDFGPRPPDHTQVYNAELYDNDGNPISGAAVMFPADTPQTDPRPLTGGHHDAGDFDQQVHHFRLPIFLMRLYEANKAAVDRDGQLTIPESANSIPDVLDEVLWELEAWEALQEADGGIRAGVESWREPFGFYYADQDPLPYWTYSRDAGHTARFAGVFAWASRLVGDYDPGSAQRLRNRALAAYDYARAHGVGYDSEGTLFLAAGELFRLTGDSRYKADFEGTADQTAATQGYPGQMFIINPDIAPPMPGGNSFMPNWADLVTGYLQTPGLDRNQWYFTSTVNQIHARAEEERRFLGCALPAESPPPQSDAAHANPHGSGSTGWGTGVAMGSFLTGIYTSLQLDADGEAPLSEDARQAYLDTLSLSADYVLGCNPAGMAWITGLGSRYPRDPLNDEALAFARDGQGLMPGICVYGPFYGLPGAWYYDYARYCCFPAFEQWPLHCRYADVHTWVSINECGPDLNALHAELFGMLLPQGIMPPDSWNTPGEERLDPLPPRDGTGGGSPPIGGPGSATIQIELLDDGAPTVLAPDAALGSDGAGSWDWTIPSNQPSGTQYSIRLTSTANSYCVDLSDGPFTIGASALTVTTPNGGEGWKGGETHAIQWSYLGDIGSIVQIELLNAGVPTVIATGVAAGTGGSGSWNWTIPAGQPDGAHYRIRVTSTSTPACADTSNGDFSIGAATMHVASPVGGETWIGGESRALQWSYTGTPGPNVRIELLDGAASTELASSVAIGAGGSGSWTWAIPAAQTAGANYRIRVTSTTAPACTDTSAGPFTILSPGVTVQVANGGELWRGGESRTLQWTYTGNPGPNVRIELLQGGAPTTLGASVALGSAGAGLWTWTIPPDQASASNYRIRVTSTTLPAATDTSNADFSISAATITVGTPNGGEQWVGGESRTIQWTYTGNPGANVRIELLQGGTPTVLVTSVAIGASGAGSWTWTIPPGQLAAANYRIHVTSTTASSIADASNADFAISTPVFTVTVPHGGETYATGDIVPIQWTYAGNPGPNVRIELLTAGVSTDLMSSVSIGSGGVGSWNWSIPLSQAAGVDYRIRVVSTTNPTSNASSPGNFTITAPTLTVASPNGGETWVAGETRTIAWSYAGAPDASVRVESLNAGVPTVLAASVPVGTGGTGSWDWAIPSSQTPATAYRIRITSASNSYCSDTSDADFTIDPPPPTLTVATPNGGDNWVAGQTATIRWTYTSDPGATARIELLDNGVATVLADGVSMGSGGAGSWDWAVPPTQPPGTTYRICVTSVAVPACTDTSNADFTISAVITDTITVTSPNGEENWLIWDAHPIQWTYTGDPGSSVKIELLKAGVPTVLTSNAPIGSNGTGSWTWNMPLTQEQRSDYTIRITSNSTPACIDTSDDFFTISRWASVRVEYPDGGEQWTAGETRTIRWSYAGNPGSAVRISLVRGGNSTTLVSSVSIGANGKGSWDWNIPPGQTPASNYRITVATTGFFSSSDTSDGTFTINAPTITVATPNGGETYITGDAAPIQWTYTGYPGDTVRVELLDNGVPTLLADGVPTGGNGSGAWTWNTSFAQPLGTQYQVRVTSVIAPSVTDTSDGAFIITKVPPRIAGITVVPSSGKSLSGTPLNLTVVLAAGTPELFYQWAKDGTAIQDATAATLTIGASCAQDTGAYTCTVTNAAGSDTSTPVMITIADPLRITAPPEGADVTVHDAHVFSVGTTGGFDPLTYEWYKVGVPVPLSTDALLAIDSAELTDAGAYYVTVSDSDGNFVQSDPVDLSVQYGVPAGGIAALLLTAAICSLAALRTLRGRC